MPPIVVPPIVINEVSGGTVTHVAIALTFGLIVWAMIYAIGHISGCHLNPAVTLGFLVARWFEGNLVVPFIVSQCLGAISASLTLKLLLPASVVLGATLPFGTASQSFVLEVVLPMILMFAILCVSSGSKETGARAGVAVGAVIALAPPYGEPISGASMNPARLLQPSCRCTTKIFRSICSRRLRVPLSESASSVPFKNLDRKLFRKR